MRPVNLIPPELRRGLNAPMRSGPIVYIVVGALIAVLAGVTALVLTGNEIAESKAEIAQLHRETTAVKARVNAFAAYTQFRTLREHRIATVASLADSRFDWERVMRELSRVVPNDVQLTKLTATDSPKASSGSGSSGSSGSSGLRSSIAGPAIEMTGCAVGQKGVAGFVTVLKEIDGVTRVGVESSAISEESGGSASASSGSSGESGGEQCAAGLAKFQLVVAFDAAPIPSEPSASEAAAAAAPATAAGGSSTTASSASSPEGEG